MVSSSLEPVKPADVYQNETAKDFTWLFAFTARKPNRICRRVSDLTFDKLRLLVVKHPDTKNLKSDTFIHIVGSNKLQNGLLLTFLSDKTGLKGGCLPHINSKSFEIKSSPSQKEFILIDLKDIESDHLWSMIHSLKTSFPSRFFIGIFNVASNDNFEKMALSNGIQGVFFENDSPEMITKGICAILNGDLWYPRKSLTKFLLESNASTKSQQDTVSSGLLTSREKEIIVLLASGRNSKEIANALCISTHTVKTHIYNIYGKINARNRLQATLWAAKYL